MNDRQWQRYPSGTKGARWLLYIVASMARAAMRASVMMAHRGHDDGSYVSDLGG
jgi:hypothetical protein